MYVQHVQLFAVCNVLVREFGSLATPYAQNTYIFNTPEFVPSFIRVPCYILCAMSEA